MTEPVWRTHLGPQAHATGYHGNPRPEVVQRLGITPSCLLEIGCGSGATARLVKELHPGCRVIGVETNAGAIDLARPHLDVAYNSTFEDVDIDAADFPKGSVDAVILCDVLEHMVNPWAALEKLRKVVASGARVAASIPNVRNLMLLDQVARGGWQYEAQGLLDITHLRFFSLRDMMRMFAETGFRVLTSYRLPDGRMASVPIPQENQLTNLNTGVLQLQGLSRQDVLELTALQFVVIAEPV